METKRTHASSMQPCVDLAGVSGVPRRLIILQPPQLNECLELTGTLQRHQLLDQ